MTILLVAAVCAVFLAEVRFGVAGSETALVPWGALLTRGWSAADAWRTLTFSFLHLNPLHLALDAALLFSLGRIVERRTGARVMAAIFFAGALGSGIAGMLLGPVLPTTGVAVGSSGADCGLLAAALLIAFSSARDERLRRPLVIAAIAIAVISFLPGVSLAGHIGGFLGGGAMATALTRRPDGHDA